MERINLMLLILVLQLMFQQTLMADVRLPAILSSNMVLQRSTDITIWGWADRKEIFSVEFSWLKEPLIIQADESGNWTFQVKTNNDKKPQRIEIISNDSIINIENILFGEVWLCSGQSNMRQSLSGHVGQPTFGSLMAVAKSSNPNLRIFSAGGTASKSPLDDFEKYSSWQQTNPENVLNFSAIAYFFGQQLQQILDCPIGIIHSTWGGSKVQSWISNEMLKSIQIVNIEDIDLTERPNHMPTIMYNSMINPLIHFKIKGVLWYQGESDRKEPEKYKKLFPAMVQDWRNHWNIGDFPFYFVQIAPFTYGNNEAFDTFENSAFLREAQMYCLDIIPNSRIIITLDIGDERSIHPPRKKEVADRLLFNVLNSAYGYNSINCKSPNYKSMEIVKGGILLKFKNGENGLFTYDSLDNFEISGNDRIFYPADAKIVNSNDVFVQNPNVKNPVAVRYAWNNYVIGTLFGNNLLPVSSFRTDNWDDATRLKP